MTKEELIALAQKHAQGNCSEEEARLVESFYEELQQRDVNPDWSENTEKYLRNRMLTSISERIGEKKQKRSTFSWGRIAAAVLILLSTGFGIYLTRNTAETVIEVQKAVVETTDSQRRQISLPDGSLVTLNVGSRIEYPENFSDTLRQITLIGEAYFDVKRDPYRPFVVESNGLTTQVLGTSFNVRAYPQEAQDVTVVTGRVEVSKANSSVVLGPGEQAYLDVAGLKSRDVDLDFYTGWFSDEIEFDLISFDQALEKLSRWYHQDFDIKNQQQVEECLVRARFGNEGVRHILVVLQSLVDFDFEVLDDETIQIINRGCIN